MELVMELAGTCIHGFNDVCFDWLNFSHTSPIDR